MYLKIQILEMEALRQLQTDEMYRLRYFTAL